MAADERAGDRVEVTISGDVSGQVVAGSGNIVSQTRTGPSPEELAELRGLFADLAARARAEASPELREEAVRQVRELEDATMAETPDVSRIVRTRRWLVEHLPTLAGGVTGLLVNPIVGKLVEVAGDAVARQFREAIGDKAAGEKEAT